MLTTLGRVLFVLCFAVLASPAFGERLIDKFGGDCAKADIPKEELCKINHAAGSVCADYKADCCQFTHDDAMNTVGALRGLQTQIISEIGKGVPGVGGLTCGMSLTTQGATDIANLANCIQNNNCPSSSGDWAAQAAAHACAAASCFQNPYGWTTTLVCAAGGFLATGIKCRWGDPTSSAGSLQKSCSVEMCTRQPLIDGNTCCCKRKDGSWAFDKEHPCMNAGGKFTPGTCGVGLPSSVDQCATWQPPRTPLPPGGLVPAKAVEHKAIMVE